MLMLPLRKPTDRLAKIWQRFSTIGGLAIRATFVYPNYPSVPRGERFRAMYLSPCRASPQSDRPFQRADTKPPALRPVVVLLRQYRGPSRYATTHNAANADKQRVN